MITLLPASGHLRAPWRNRGGFSREIVRHPDSVDWSWRASTADVGADGPFSCFPGYDRDVVLLSGQGLDLHFDDGGLQRLSAPHGRTRFAGERAVTALLADGPVAVFNLLWRRDRFEAHLLHRPIVGSMLFFGEPAVTWLLFVLAGHVRTPSGLLDVGDAARLAIAPGQRLVIDGGGEVLLAKLTAKD